MDEQSDATPTLTLAHSLGTSVSQPTGRLILRDETGQPWVVTVRTDGQLQTAKLLVASGDNPVSDGAN